MPAKSILPFIILGLGFLWFGACEWIRRRALKRPGATRPEGNAEPLALVGILGLLLCMIVAGFVAAAKWL